MILPFLTYFFKGPISAVVLLAILKQIVHKRSHFYDCFQLKGVDSFIDQERMKQNRLFFEKFLPVFEPNEFLLWL